MSSGAPLQKITRLRTYSDDMALARSRQSQVEQVTPTAPKPDTLSQVIPVPPKPTVNPEHKISTVGVIHQNLVEEKEDTQDPLVVTVPLEQTPIEYKPVLKKNNHAATAIETAITKVAVTHKASILSDSENVYDGSNQSSEGTIIKDTKRKRFRLFPAMWQALKDGFYNDLEKFKHTHTEQTIAKAETRIDVLNKAIQNSERAPRADFKEIAEHLKNLERKPIENTISFKRKEALPLPTWSSTSETAQEQTVEELLVILPEAKNDVVVETVVPTIVETKVTETEIPKIREDSVVKESVPPQLVPSQETIEYTASTIAKQSEKKPTIPTALLTKTKRAYASPRVTTKASSFPTYVLIAVILLASVCGVTVTYYFFTFKNAPKAVESYSVPSAVRAEKNNSFVLPSDAREFSSAVQKSIGDGTGVTQVYPTVALSTGGERPATTAEILAVLQLHAPASFIRSIKEISFGGSGSEAPFIIITGTNFDTLFAGILAWEQTIQTDFTPLFGINRSNALFTDALASNKNIRVLQNSQGEDLIVYTFIDQNTILITTKREQIGFIVPRVK